MDLGEDAIVLRTASATELELAVAKVWTFQPGAPFVGDAEVSMARLGRVRTLSVLVP